jgi:exodeoxyribonuclease VII large subunit
MEQLLHSHANTLSSLDARLHSLSPLAVLDRGYALVLNLEGSVVRSASQLKTGDTLTTRLADGSFTSRVKATSSTGKASK